MCHLILNFVVSFRVSLALSGLVGLEAKRHIDGGIHFWESVIIFVSVELRKLIVLGWVSTTTTYSGTV